MSKQRRLLRFDVDEVIRAASSMHKDLAEGLIYSLTEEQRGKVYQVLTSQKPVPEANYEDHGFWSIGMPPQPKDPGPQTAEKVMDLLHPPSKAEILRRELSRKVEREKVERRQASSRGGKAPKYAKAIMAEAERILRRAPKLKALEVFKMFPKDETRPARVTLEDGAHEVYRNDVAIPPTLVQIDPRGNEHEVSQRSFIDRYLPKARSLTK